MSGAAYDGNGLRASTTITPAGGSPVTQGYVWNTIPQVPQLIMDGTSAYIYDGGLAPAEQVHLAHHPGGGRRRSRNQRRSGRRGGRL